MRKYNVNVNGTAYEVTVEEIQGGAAPAPVAAPAAPAPAPVPAAPATAGSGEPVSAPMPGTILDVKVAAGQAVKSGYEDGERDYGSQGRHRHQRDCLQRRFRGKRHSSLHHRLSP